VYPSGTGGYTNNTARPPGLRYPLQLWDIEKRYGHSRQGGHKTGKHHPTTVWSRYRGKVSWHMDNEYLCPVRNSEETRARALLLHWAGITVDGGAPTRRDERGLWLCPGTQGCHREFQLQSDPRRTGERKCVTRRVAGRSRPARVHALFSRIGGTFRQDIHLEWPVEKETGDGDISRSFYRSHGRVPPNDCWGTHHEEGPGCWKTDARILEDKTSIEQFETLWDQLKRLKHAFPNAPM